jgi:hypothetical protein
MKNYRPVEEHLLGLCIDDFNNLDDVYRKIYAATGMESFGRKPISAKTKTGTNDPITEMQGIGQNVYKGFNID